MKAFGASVRAGLLLGIACLCTGATQADDRVDLLIRGGTVYPGAADPFVGDVAVEGDRIVAIGPGLKVDAARIIDVTDMIVAPGFIDPQAGIENELTSTDATTRLIPALLLQGVTTAIVGNDGDGTLEIAGYFAAATRTGVNHAVLVGILPIRRAVIGIGTRAPTLEELTRMRKLVEAAMCEGALGLSTGIPHQRESPASTGEGLTESLTKPGSDALASHSPTKAGFAREFDEDVRRRKTLTLREFVDRNTAHRARAFGLAGRGELKVGNFADIVVIDPDVYAPAVSAQQATRRTQGVRTVLVNGVPAVDGFELTGAAAGRALRHASSAGTCR